MLTTGSSLKTSGLLANTNIVQNIASQLALLKAFSCFVENIDDGPSYLKKIFEIFVLFFLATQFTL